MLEGSIRLEISSSRNHLALLGSAVRAIAAAAGLNESRSFQTELAVVEATTNVIRHALGDSEDSTIFLEIAVDAAQVTFELRDSGTEMPKNTLEDASLHFVDLDGGLDSFPEGGMGLGLIKEAMDSVSYERVGDTNVLRMILERES